MLSKEMVLASIRAQGKADATNLQARAAKLTGTQLYAENDKIPSFVEARTKKNMSERTAGQENGFVCKSSAGRVVRLIQSYNSDTYPQEPEELPAQWRFVWSQDPEKALPFISLSTSPYAKGDCCLNAAGEVRRSTINNNVWSPDTNPEFWEEVVA